MRDFEGLLARLRTGEITLREAVRDDSATFRQVREILIGIDGIGVTRAAAICGDAEVAPWLQAQDVTDAQLDRLEAQL